MTQPPKPYAREQLFRWFFFGVFALILWQLVKVFSAFLTGFLWAGILTVMFYPLHAAMLRSKRVSTNMAALISTLCVLLAFVLPMTLFSWLTIREAASVYPALREWTEEVRALAGNSAGALPVPEALRYHWDRIQEVTAPLGLDLQEMALRNINVLTVMVADAGAHVARHLFLSLFNFLVLILALFFLFKDGSTLIRWGVDLIPMESQHKKHLLEQVNQTFSAVVRGFLAVAVLQGFFAGLGFYVAGVAFPLLLGAICILAAFIPIGGTVLVWGPVCGYMLYKGMPNAIPLLIWCAIMVSSLDNILKAWFIGSQMRIPLLLLFLSLLGGMQAYGFLGILLGPLLLTCALAFVRIYREEYHIRLPHEPKPEHA